MAEIEKIIKEILDNMVKVEVKVAIKKTNYIAYDAIINHKSGSNIPDDNLKEFKKYKDGDAFSVSRYQVTQEQFEVIMGKNPSNFKGKDLPVEYVNWYHAMAFCNKLSLKNKLQIVYSVKGIDDWENLKFEDIPIGRNKNWDNVDTNNKEKKGFRLLTEAEWEYAAWGGIYSKNYEYAGCNSKSELSKYAWYYENSGNEELDDTKWDVKKMDKNKNRTHDVGLKLPNELGLYDMSGNVWEWCEDWYDNKTRSARVLRGGSWINHAEDCGVSDRDSYYPDSHDLSIGFRLACSL